jgi:hypothetical protein
MSTSDPPVSPTPEKPIVKVVVNENAPGLPWNVWRRKQAPARPGKDETEQFFEHLAAIDPYQHK